jgi:hypothetical protein
VDEPLPADLEALRQELYDFCLRDCQNEFECNPEGLSEAELRSDASDCVQGCLDYADDGEISQTTAPCIRLFVDAGDCMFALSCAQYIQTNDWVSGRAPEAWGDAPYCGSVLAGFVQACN